MNIFAKRFGGIEAALDSIVLKPMCRATASRCMGCRRAAMQRHSSALWEKKKSSTLASHPGRVEYVHTPEHGSWLNPVESAFSKATHFPPCRTRGRPPTLGPEGE